MGRRVVVTGMGTVNPLGNNVKDFWRGIKAGNNGISVLDRFDNTLYDSKVAGQVKDFAAEKIFESTGSAAHGPFHAVRNGIRPGGHGTGGPEAGDVDPERFGVILGNGIGGIETLEAAFRRSPRKGPRAFTLSPCP